MNDGIQCYEGDGIPEITLICDCIRIDSMAARSDTKRSFDHLTLVASPDDLEHAHSALSASIDRYRIRRLRITGKVEGPGMTAAEERDSRGMLYLNASIERVELFPRYIEFVIEHQPVTPVIVVGRSNV